MEAAITIMWAGPRMRISDKSTLEPFPVYGPRRYVVAFMAWQSRGFSRTLREQQAVIQ